MHTQPIRKEADQESQFLCAQVVLSGLIGFGDGEICMYEQDRSLQYQDQEKD